MPFWSLQITEYGAQWNPLLKDTSMEDDHGTSHISVVDSKHNAVSMTTSVNTVFGSLVVSPSTGILFNNQVCVGGISQAEVHEGV